MTAHPVSLELTMLGCAIALVLVQITLQAASRAPFLSPATLMGSRDTANVIDNKYVGRIDRALRNVLETFPLFAAAVLGVVAAGRTSSSTAHGAEIYVWARTLYVPAYISGIPFLRTIIWGVSIAGIVMILWQLLA